MNERSALYKALSERGEEMKLSSDFQLRMMCQIHAIEARKKRREHVWSIVGYATAIITAVVTLVMFCGNIFTQFFKRCIENITADYQSLDFTSVGDSMTHGISAINPLNFTLPTIILISTSLLLILDRLMRKRYGLIKNINKNDQA